MMQKVTPSLRLSSSLSSSSPSSLSSSSSETLSCLDQGLELGGGVASRRESQVGDQATLESSMEAPPPRRRGKRKKAAAIGDVVRPQR